MIASAPTPVNTSSKARVYWPPPVRIDPELRAAIEARAEADHTSTSEIIRQALRKFLDVPYMSRAGGTEGRVAMVPVKPPTVTTWSCRCRQRDPRTPAAWVQGCSRPSELPGIDDASWEALLDESIAFVDGVS